MREKKNMKNKLIQGHNTQKKKTQKIPVNKKSLARSKNPSTSIQYPRDPN